ncbi:MAG TPA: nuclear transport factor 2 family protein [Steroidobacteraceae bacterium]|nr:nuclear transport factor 2 family protein [Steroidobacteraceae bacterium]
MTVDEMIARESIRRTMASYTMAGDRLRVDDFIAVFTDDAVLESDGVPESDAFRYEGRQAIRDWMDRWRRSASAAQRAAGSAALRAAQQRSAPADRATFVRHHLSTSQIEFSGPDTAQARTYWVAYTDIGPDHCGYYLDEFRKSGGQWLIAHRRVRLDWRSPRSLFKTAIAGSR